MDTINVRLDKQNKPIEIIKDTGTSLIRAFPDLEDVIEYVYECQEHNITDILSEMEQIDSNTIKDLLLSKNQILNNLGINILSEFLSLYDDSIDDNGMELPIPTGACIEVYQFILLDKKEKTK